MDSLDARIEYAVERGMQSFLGSDDCSPELRKQIAEEHGNADTQGARFNDLLRDGVIGTASSFLASIASGIARAVFGAKKRPAAEQLHEIAEEVTKVRMKEMELVIGPAGVRRISVTNTDTQKLSSHILTACRDFKD